MRKTTMHKLWTFLLVTLFSVTLQAQSFVHRVMGYPQGTPSANYLSIVNDNVVWTMNGATYGLSISTDAGNTWTWHASALPAEFTMTSFSATSATTAYMVGFGQAGGVYQTTDAGATWTLQPSGITAGSFINSIHFFDAQNGVIMGDQDEQGYFEIYTTANAGASWSRVSLANLPPDQTVEYGITNVYDAVGDAIWFVTGTNGTTPRRLFRSFNKGQTWTATNIAGMSNAYEDTQVTFADQNRGIMIVRYLVGTAYYSDRYLTLDGGATFNYLAPVGIPEITPFESIEFIPGTTYVVSVQGNSTYISKDNGVNWELLSSTYGGGKPYFRNISTGYRIGGYKWINSISLIGQGIGTPWTTDVDMSTDDGINYSLSDLTVGAGGLKFRQNHEWAPVSQDWGSNAFPLGTGVQSGPDIPATAGTYDVTFNRLTGAYVFENALGVDERQEMSFRIYPNPVSGTLFVESADAIGKMTILDMTGKVMMRTQNVDRVDVGALASGIYMIVIEAANAREVIKFVKS